MCEIFFGGDFVIFLLIRVIWFVGPIKNSSLSRAVSSDSIGFFISFSPVKRCINMISEHKLTFTSNSEVI